MRQTGTGDRVCCGSTTAAAAPFRVVVDAGHGGSNTGAPGLVAGAYEKQVTLAVARALADELARDGVRGGHDARPRRVPDAARARAAGQRRRPDCFVSLHTNASGNSSRRGVETWVLARDAAEVEARRAASRERDDVRVDADGARAARRAARLGAAGARAAGASRGRDGQRDRGVRQYGYDVLAGVTAPAVLVEMGFLDHPIEGAALLEPARAASHRRGAGLGDRALRRRRARPAKAGNVRSPHATTRPDGRRPDELRPLTITPDYSKDPEGSALIRAGDTWVLCTASVEEKVPPFLKDSGKGWVTAEYAMLPRATNTRSEREPGGRGKEIERLIGRALRASIDLAKLGQRTITIDCDVLQADGGTRTAAITGG